MDSIRRPTKNDDENDLLKFQEEFIKNSHKSAVKLVKRSPPKSGDVKSPMKQQEKDVVRMELDKTNKSSQAKQRSKFKMDIKPGDSDVPTSTEKYMDQHDTHITSILSKIQERDISHVVINFPKPSTLAFPMVVRNHGANTETTRSEINPKKAPSLFARQFKAAPESFHIPFPSDYAKMDQSDIPIQVLPKLEKNINIDALQTAFPAPNIISGVGLLGTKQNQSTTEKSESNQIHKESIEKLSQMTEQDILLEQEKLMKFLDPNIVNFIKSKHALKQDASKNEATPPKLQKTRDEEMLEKLKNIAMEEAMDTEEKINGEFELPIQTSKNWVNMKTVEWEKMQWLKDVPKKDKDKKVEFPHRFDFDGKLLNPNDELPAYMGLHHHGLEPDLPGYTLQELMMLSRSQFKQQRVLALTSLANILKQDANGKYSKMFDESVTSILMDAGILFLLRWSLDEQNPNIFPASVDALHSLLVLPSADSILDEMFMSNRGCEIPCLHPFQSANKHDKEENDFEVAQRDVIESLVRMDLLPRMRYILEVLNPSQHTKIQIIEILMRICHHSTQSCVEIEKCPRLIELITADLMSIKHDEKASVFPYFVSLLRFIATGGRHVAGRLLTNALRETILFYAKTTAFGYNNADPYTQTQHQIWKLATVLCGYEYLKESMSEILHNAVLPKLQTTNEILYETSVEQMEEKFDSLLKESCLFLNFCANAVYVKVDEGNMDSVIWSDIAVWVVSLLNRVINLLQQNPNRKNKSLSLLLTTSLKYLTSYYKTSSSANGVNRLEFNEKVELFVKEVLIQMFPIMTSCVTKCRIESIPKLKVTKKMDSLLCFPLTNENFNIAQLQLLSMYLKCCVIVCKINKACCNHLYPIIQIISTHCDWMTENTSSLPPVARYFVRDKVFCCYWASRLAHVMTLQKLTTEEEKSFYHSVALTTFTAFTLSDEFYANNVLSLHLFDVDFIQADHDKVENIFSKMVLNNSHEGELLFNGYKNIPMIRSMYFNLLKMDEKALSTSRNRCLSVFSEVDNYLLPPCDGSYIPCDWMFLPLLHEYECAVNRPDSAIPSKSESLLPIQHCLEFIYILQSGRQMVLQNIPNIAKIARLFCVFLAGNDFFLDVTISRCISALLKEFCQNTLISELDFGKEIPGIPFYDFYCSLLDQFSGVSFGNALFASSILVPLHQHSTVYSKYCKALWVERKELIRIINITEQQLFIPKQYYFSPIETDLELLSAYIRALASGACRRELSPLLYHIAVHHLSSFLFSKNKISTDKTKLFKMVMKISNGDVKNHILYYNGQNNFEFTISESPLRNEMINNYKNNL